MSNATIETPATAAQPETETKPKKGAKGAKPAKKAKPKPAKNKKLTAERSNKKAEVIALMKRAKGVTLAEIAGQTGWQNHTIRGFVSILGKKGEHNIESSKNSGGERTYRITK